MLKPHSESKPGHERGTCLWTDRPQDTVRKDFSLDHLGLRPQILY